MKSLRVLAIAGATASLVSPVMAQGYAERLVDSHQPPPPVVQPQEARRAQQSSGSRFEATPAEEFRNLKQFIEQNSRIINVQELTNQMTEHLSPSERFRMLKETADRDLRQRQLKEKQLPMGNMMQPQLEGTLDGVKNSSSEGREQQEQPESGDERVPPSSPS